MQGHLPCTELILENSSQNSLAAFVNESRRNNQFCLHLKWLIYFSLEYLHLCALGSRYYKEKRGGEMFFLLCPSL